MMDHYIKATDKRMANSGNLKWTPGDSSKKTRKAERAGITYTYTYTYLLPPLVHQPVKDCYRPGGGWWTSPVGGQEGYNGRNQWANPPLSLAGCLRKAVVGLPGVRRGQ